MIILDNKVTSLSTPVNVRKELWQLLAEAFVYPGAVGFLFLSNLEKQLEHVAEQFKHLQKLAHKEGLEALCVEYTRLFIGPYHVPVPPYGSVYLENHGRLQGDSTAEVAHYYRDFGLNTDDNQLADHVQVELEFLYFLAAAEETDPVNSEYYQSAALEFQSTYLHPWIGAFVNKLANAAQGPFYTELGRLLQSCVASP